MAIGAGAVRQYRVAKSLHDAISKAWRVMYALPAG
jgi:hypothetical protein